MERKIKVTYVISSLRSGGAENHLYNLIANLDKEEFQPKVVTVVNAGPLFKPMSELGVEIVNLNLIYYRKKYDRLSFLFILWRLFSSFKRKKPDIVVGYLPPAHHLATVAARLAKVPSIISSRRRLKQGLKRNYRFFDKLLTNWNDLIICPSDAVRKETIKEERVDPEKVITIYNGVDLRKFSTRLDSSTNNRQKTQFGFPLDSLVIGSVANLYPWKGQQFLITAFDRLVKELPDIFLVLIGDGPHREYLQDQALSLGLGDRVNFLGQRMDVSEVISAIDVFVLPSLEEGMPNALLEAMASGKPCIASAVGGVNEIIEDQYNGLLVKPGDVDSISDALSKTIASPTMQKKFAANARKTVEEKFDLKEMVKSFEVIYEKMYSQQTKDFACHFES